MNHQTIDWSDLLVPGVPAIRRHNLHQGSRFQRSHLGFGHVQRQAWPQALLDRGPPRGSAGPGGGRQARWVHILCLDNLFLAHCLLHYFVFTIGNVVNLLLAGCQIWPS